MAWRMICILIFSLFLERIPIQIHHILGMGLPHYLQSIFRRREGISGDRVGGSEMCCGSGIIANGYVSLYILHFKA